MKKLAIEIANQQKRVQATKEFARREAQKLLQAATETRELTTFLPAPTPEEKCIEELKGQGEEAALAKRSRVLQCERPRREVGHRGAKQRTVQGDIVSFLGGYG